MQWACRLHTTPTSWEEVSKSKNVVEKAVDSLKERRPQTPSPEVKPPLLVRVKETVMHTITGFRLFWLDVKISFRLLRKTTRGGTLTRRELKQFRRTVADIFRLVPFSVFIVVPFMEFLLPVYLYFFPNMLPSTFQSSSNKDARKKAELQVKLKMAQFLQDTIEDMALESKGKKKAETVKEFAEFLEKIRTSGQQASTEDIMRFSKLFEDELTLGNLSHQQLTALCRMLLLKPIGTSNFLRFQLYLKLRQLEADDRMIMKEGVESLDDVELQAACQARGMRALGLPVQRLRNQLDQWLDLHLNKQIPTSLLLLSRAMYLPDLPAEVAIKAAISELPQNITDEAELQVAASSGEEVDNRARAKVLMQQEQLIREEAEEETVHAEEVLKEAKEKIEVPEEVAIETGHKESRTFSKEFLRDFSKAVETLKKDSLLKEELKELMEEKKEYDEVVEGLKQVEDIQVSKPASRLARRVESMISQVNRTVQALEEEYVGRGDQLTEEETVSREELAKALKTFQVAPQEAMIARILSVLDEDFDGNISMDELTEVIELIAREDTELDEESLQQIITLLKKEEFWESQVKQLNQS
jgi:LETM1 and EF-hand domain-containing protein 1